MDSGKRKKDSGSESEGRDNEFAGPIEVSVIVELVESAKVPVITEPVESAKVPVIMDLLTI